MEMVASPRAASTANPFCGFSSSVDLEAESHAFQLGFTLGRAGTPASPVSWSPERVRASFYLGVETGEHAAADRINRP